MERTRISGLVFRPLILDMFQLRRSRVSRSKLVFTPVDTQTAEGLPDDLCYLTCQQGWNRIANLLVLCGDRTNKIIVVGKGLQPGCLPDRQTPALQGVRMDKIVPVLSDVACDGRRGLAPDLNPEPVAKDDLVLIHAYYVLMVRKQKAGKIRAW